MSFNSARIESTEVLKDFKAKFEKFGDTCRQAIGGVQSDTHGTLQWLRHDQKSYWKRALIKSDQDIERARSAYTEARYGHEAIRKTSFIDEQRNLRRAEARKELVLRKIDTVKKWTSLLEQQSEKLLGPVNQLSSMISVDLPKASAELERMTIALEEYLKQGPPTS
jgi:hypothetical protein